MRLNWSRSTSITWAAFFGMAGCIASGPPTPPEPSSPSIAPGAANPSDSVSEHRRETEMPSMSSHLSPHAKRIAMLNEPDQQVSALVNVAGSLKADDFRQNVQGRGGTVVSWSGPEAGNVANVRIPAGQLNNLAQSAGVIYVEADGRYQP